ncbi:hypothetical protein GLAREA_04314 [Glarea lozoyensis ATCC 20868]|uniref:Uncharacterized protein n=1 Tax=Glarea lozoyensis (strain ATCC 20868 / MF5171) TaxID=1116229 RepID=S3DLW6_GLAL2|nr:uncharacterized protein GLAREA_04314 [Glarea lozoyensis ATCC 20868]EPE27523.1 hypothetical protein GLAREA_04314 [Glarea lozoyensis ATCC 20868]
MDRDSLDSRRSSDFYIPPIKTHFPLTLSPIQQARSVSQQLSPAPNRGSIPSGENERRSFQQRPSTPGPLPPVELSRQNAARRPQRPRGTLPSNPHQRREHPKGPSPKDSPQIFRMKNSHDRLATLEDHYPQDGWYCLSLDNHHQHPEALESHCVQVSKQSPPPLDANVLSEQLERRTVPRTQPHITPQSSSFPRLAPQSAEIFSVSDEDQGQNSSFQGNSEQDSHLRRNYFSDGQRGISRPESDQQRHSQYRNSQQGNSGGSNSRGNYVTESEGGTHPQRNSTKQAQRRSSHQWSSQPEGQLRTGNPGGNNQQNRGTNQPYVNVHRNNQLGTVQHGINSWGSDQQRNNPRGSDQDPESTDQMSFRQQRDSQQGRCQQGSDNLGSKRWSNPFGRK